MLVKVIANYTGPKVNAKPVANPTSQYGARDWNRAHEDLAQATRTIGRAIVSFVTVAAGDPLPANTSHRSVWGLSATEKPIATRTSAGLYLVTYATSFDDGLGLPDSVESVAFAFPPNVRVMTSTGVTTDDLFARPTGFTANTFSVAVYAAGVLADVGDVSAAALTITCDIV